MARGPVTEEAFSDSDFAPAEEAFSDDDFAPTKAAASAPAPAASPLRSAAESIARGGAQGLTAGFADEMAGAAGLMTSGIGGLLSPIETYKRGRDNYRAEDKAAKEAHGGKFTAAEVGTGIASAFIPGAGILKGATLAGKAARAGIAGATSALGSSEANTLRGAATDAAIGFGTGAALTGAVGKLAKGAPDRLLKRDLRNIVTGGSKSERDKLLGKMREHSGDVHATFKAHAPEVIRAKGAAAQAEALSSKLDELDGARASLYGAYNATGEAVSDLSVTAKMRDAVAERFGKSAADKPKLQAAERIIKDYAESRKDAGGKIAFDELRQEASKFGKNGYAGTLNDRSAAGEVNRVISGAMVDALHEAVETTAKRHPNVGSLSELKSVNKQYSTFLKAKDIIDRKRGVDADDSFTMAKGAKSAINAGAWGASLMTMNPLPILGAKAAEHALPAATKMTDKALAGYVKLVKQGGKPGELLSRGVSMGIPADLARRIVASSQPGASFESE